MPTISFDFDDFLKLLGRKLSSEQFGELLLNYAKAELEHHDKRTGEVIVKLGDTNLPYLWSAEGLAVLLKGVLGIEKGIPKLPVKKAGHKILVDRSISQIRPYIAAFVAKGKSVDEYLLRQLVQMQEKLSENYGRKRQKISIGLYKFKNISWPLHYKAVDPESVRFVPLEFGRALNLKQILEQHPKGKQYARILLPFKSYPIFIDNRGEVLSFPPIINSNTTGKVIAGDDELLIEVTGSDESSVNLAANIFAQAMHMRGFSLESVEIDYPTKKLSTPLLKNGEIRINGEQIMSLLGIDLKVSEVKSLLEKARFDFDNYKVTVPHFRNDIMDPVDVIEDIGIVYGYDKIPALKLSGYTAGGVREIVNFVDKVREICVGLGHQEIFSSILSNKELLCESMSAPDIGTVEIENSMSESYSAVRTWLMPTLVSVLSKNGHVSYPQKIFEQGLVTIRSEEKVADVESLAIASAHNDANYTEMKQVVERLLDALAVGFEVEEYDHPSFIPGRCAKAISDGRIIAFFGELHPKVLSDFAVNVPVAAAELNLSALFRSSSK